VDGVGRGFVMVRRGGGGGGCETACQVTCEVGRLEGQQGRANRIQWGRYLKHDGTICRCRLV